MVLHAPIPPFPPRRRTRWSERVLRALVQGIACWCLVACIGCAAPNPRPAEPTRAASRDEHGRWWLSLRRRGGEFAEPSASTLADYRMQVDVVRGAEMRHLQTRNPIDWFAVDGSLAAVRAVRSAGLYLVVEITCVTRRSRLRSCVLRVHGQPAPWAGDLLVCAKQDDWLEHLELPHYAVFELPDDETWRPGPVPFTCVHLLVK